MGTDTTKAQVVPRVPQLYSLAQVGGGGGQSTMSVTFGMTKDPRGSWVKVEDHAGVANECARLVRETHELGRELSRVRNELTDEIVGRGRTIESQAARINELVAEVEKLKFDKLTENKLPSQFQIGAWVNVFTCDATDGVRFSRAPAQVKGVHFTESKVSYDVEIGVASDLMKGCAEPLVIRVPSELVCAP